MWCRGSRRERGIVNNAGVKPGDWGRAARRTSVARTCARPRSQVSQIATNAVTSSGASSPTSVESMSSWSRLSEMSAKFRGSGMCCRRKYGISRNADAEHQFVQNSTLVLMKLWDCGTRCGHPHAGEQAGVNNLPVRAQEAMQARQHQCHAMLRFHPTADYI